MPLTAARSAKSTRWSGDSNADIFDGLAIATSTFGKPRYVPSEQVDEITEGTVRLSLTPAQVDQLGEYLEPATSAQIEPNSKGGMGESVKAEARELEGKAFAPTQRQEHSMNIWRRIAFFFRRLSASAPCRGRLAGPRFCSNRRG